MDYSPLSPERLLGYYCGGCRTTYSPQNLLAACVFIGRGDELEEGDNKLAYYNCRCDNPGTFTLAEDPPEEEPLENLMAMFQHRVAHLERFLDSALTAVLPTQAKWYLGRAITAGEIVAERLPASAPKDALLARLARMREQKASL